MTEASPFPKFHRQQLYVTFECSQCDNILRFGQFAFVPDIQDEEDDDDDGGEETDPLSYRHPKYVFCSAECLKAAESEHWEEAAEEREQAELARQSTLAHADRDEGEDDGDDETEVAMEEERKREEEQDAFLHRGILPGKDDKDEE